MSRPPCIVDLTVGRSEGPPRHLWLPVFLLWPLLALLGLLALMIALVADVVWRASGRPDGQWTAMIVHLFLLLGETSGLQIRIEGPSRTFDLIVR
jgi:hypothetical protein